jgi:hypothetical protein
VPSSTSSSNDRLPRGGWAGTWQLTLLIVGVLLGGWELFLRSHGVTSSVEANKESWILAREQVRPTSTVVTGSSRIQAVIDPALWTGEFGGTPPIDLALAGGSPIPVLEDLAADTAFHGLVLAEVLSMYAFDLRGDGASTVDEYLAAYRRARTSPATRWEAWLRVHVAGHFAFRRTEVLPQESYATLLHGRLPALPFGNMGPDRYHPVFFRQVGLPANRPSIMDTIAFRPAMLNTRPAQGAALDSLLHRMQASVAAIEQRGGHVVFLRFPACGGRRALEEEFFPRNEYWNQLAALTGAPAIDLGDYPEVTTLDCFDGSHIDLTDAPRVAQLIMLDLRRQLPVNAFPEQHRIPVSSRDRPAYP